MKSYRQKLSMLIDERITNETDPNKIELLNEIKDEIKSMEKEEESMVNRSYESGYIDGIKNNGRESNFYKKTYKTHDILKSMIK